jgi:hypothetical protein
METDRPHPEESASFPRETEQFLQAAIDLVERTQVELESALSRYEACGSGILHGYQLLAGRHLSAAVRGYSILRRAGEVSAAHHLLRPILEVTIRIKAISREPTTLYRVAMGEMTADMKWMQILGQMPSIEQVDTDTIIKDRMDMFHQAYVTEFPDHDLSAVPRSGLDGLSLARAAGLDAVYQSHYRMFCRHSHGDLSALAGQYTDLDLREDSFVAGCVLEILSTLEEAGVEIPTLPGFSEEQTAMAQVRTKGRST